MRTVTLHLGPSAEQVKQTAQRHIGKWIKSQIAKEQREEAV